MKQRTIYIVLISLLFGNLAAQDLPEKYLNEAIENNPGVQAAYAEYEATMQLVPQAKSLPDPSLSASYQIVPIETKLGPQRGKVSVMQMFPWFGTLDARSKKAAKMAETKYNLFLAERNQLILVIKQLWFDIYATDQKIKTAEEQILLLEKIKTHSTIKYETNQGSMADVIQFQILIEEQNNKLAKLTQHLNTLKMEFNLQLGREPDTVIEIPKILEASPDYTPTIDQIANNPFVQASQSGIAAAKIQQQLAKLNARPKIGFGLDYVIVGKHTDMVMDKNGQDAIMPMVSMTLPIWKKKNKALKKESSIRLKQSELNQEKVLDQLEISFLKTEEKYINSERDIKLYTELIKQTELALNLVEGAYINSGRDLNQVLRLYGILYNYQLEKIDSEVEQAKLLAKLMYITGK